MEERAQVIGIAELASPPVMPGMYHEQAALTQSGKDLLDLPFRLAELGGQHAHSRARQPLFPPVAPDLQHQSQLSIGHA
jgi:hypothetical protein